MYNEDMEQIGKFADSSGILGAPPCGELIIHLFEDGRCGLCGQIHHSEWQDKRCRADAMMRFESQPRKV